MSYKSGFQQNLKNVLSHGVTAKNIITIKIYGNRHNPYKDTCNYAYLAIRIKIYQKYCWHEYLVPCFHENSYQNAER